MALIDVTEILVDPDFVDKVVQEVRVPTVNSKGENVLQIQKIINTVGSVQPASGKTIARLPEAFRVANVYSFWIKGTIIATEPGKYSDILIFNGLRFEVQTVADWTNFGAGYCEGTCVAAVPA